MTLNVSVKCLAEVFNQHTMHMTLSMADLSILYRSYLDQNLLGTLFLLD